MILLISDIHGSRRTLQRIIDAERFDSIIFCGDGVNDLAFADIPGTVEVVSVLGNCDRAAGYPGKTSERITIGSIDVLIMHGDLHDAKETTSKLVSAAVARNTGAVFFGHTHLPCSVNEGGIQLVNPGAVKDGRYAMCVVKNSVLKIDFKHLPRS